MMNIKMNKRWMLTVLLGATLIGLGLVGGTWSNSSAQGTTPTLTIPVISSMTPHWYKINTPNATLQVTGENFITGWPGGPYTKLRLTEINSQNPPVWISPLALTNTTFDSILLPASVMNHAAGWDVVVVNHPDDPLLKDIEISDHFILIIDSMNFYLPLVRQ